MMTKDKKNETGLTTRVILGIIYSGIVLQPAAIWLFLVTGSPLGWAAQFATVMMLELIAKLLDKPLTKNEILTLMVGCGTATSGGFAINLLFRCYFKASEITASFKLTDALPSWFAPPVQVYYHRDLLDPNLLPIVAIMLVSTVFSILTDISLGFLTRQLFVEGERLPFPMSQVNAELCISLSEVKTRKEKVFLLSGLVGFIYGVFLYAIPMVSKSAFKVPASFIPLPWIDLNSTIERILPGASLGIATDLIIIAIGMMLPKGVIFSMLVGSVAFYFIGNPILVNFGLFTDWKVGMSLQDTWTRSILNFWASPLVGLALSAGLLPILFQPKFFIDIFKSLRKASLKESQEVISLKLIVILFSAGSIGSAILSWILVPDFPLWIFLMMSVGWYFINNLIVSRSLGLTGVSMDIPYVREGIIIASGYTRYAIWFAPINASGSGGAGWCATFKTAELVGTSPKSLVKTSLLALPFAIIGGYFFVYVFWKIAQVPSEIYPSPYWPSQVLMTSLFVTRSIATFNPFYIIIFFIFGTALQFITMFMKIPFSVIGFAAGAASPISNPFGFLVGLILGEFIKKYVLKDRYQEEKMTFVAGLFAGESLIVGLSAALAMIFEARWAMPY
ncbi:hypothetical protein KEJ33_03225 [Candidatus Bathyarchaeota archaeon]|nr:hypothetical protein [Candidatus Bathyarchaeota archaeon]